MYSVDIPNPDAITDESDDIGWMCVGKFDTRAEAESFLLKHWGPSIAPGFDVFIEEMAD